MMNRHPYRMGGDDIVVTLCTFVLGGFWAASVAGAPPDLVSVASPLRAIAADALPFVTRVELDESKFDFIKPMKHVRVSDFVLEAERRVELELEQVEVFAENARVVLGSAEGDRDIPRPDVVVFSGHVVGAPGSRAFLSLSPHGSRGYIELSGETFVLSSGPHGGNAGTVIYNLDRLPPGTIMWRPFECGVDDAPLPLEAQPTFAEGLPGNGRRVNPPPQRALIAIETDWQFVNVNFGLDYDAATAYTAALIGAVSEIYERDFNVRFQISYLRLWPDINDPWDQNTTSGQLPQFRNYWIANMGSVQRHLAHFLSGRWLGGGIAYRPGICNSSWEYGVSQVSGYFPYPLVNNHDQNWDIFVVNHEIGHNVGAPHTHSVFPLIDGCGLDPKDCSVVPNGTIMSYCHTCPGGQSNILLEFHPRIINEYALPYLDGTVGCGLTPPPATPLQAPYPHERRKNRYISFDPNIPEFADLELAFKVELKQLALGSCSGNGGFCREANGSADCNVCSVAGNPCINEPIDCAPVPPQSCDPTGEACINDAPDVGGTSVGRTWWLGPESPLGNGVHLLVSQPFRRESADWPNPTHAGDCEIVPRAVYGVRSVDLHTGAESDELEIATTVFAPISSSYWADAVGPLQKFCGGNIYASTCAGDGDCTAPATCAQAWTLPDGAVNFDDVGAALARVAPGPLSVAPEMTWVDLHGNDSGAPGSQNFDPPNFVANFSDIGQIVLGFQGRPYTFNDPADCPDVSDWP